MSKVTFLEVMKAKALERSAHLLGVVPLVGDVLAVPNVGEWDLTVKYDREAAQRNVDYFTKETLGMREATDTDTVLQLFEDATQDQEESWLFLKGFVRDLYEAA